MSTIRIKKGKTFIYPIRWGTSPFIYKPITAISRAAPCVITAALHGIPDGWRVAITSVKGMLAINALDTSPQEGDFRIATVVDVNNISLNDVDSSDFKAYVSGGFLRYYSPVDLTGFTAKAQIKDKIGGTELFLFSDANARIVLDNTAKKITLTATATDTAAMAFRGGVIDLELKSAGGVVTGIIDPTSIIIEDEVTTV